MARETFTARAAHWSATHRKTAVLGWLAFVVVAFMIGGAVGTVALKHEDMGNGDSRAAERVLAQQFPRERAAEQVLIESRNGGLLGSEYRAAVDELVARLSHTPAVAQLESPLQRGNEGQRSKNGTAVLVTFQITGDPDTAKDRVAPALAATAAVQRAHPGLFVGEFGDASVNKAIMKRIQDDFRQAEITSLPVTLLILVVAFGALVAAGIPLLLGITAVAAALGLTALFSHLMRVDESINSVILLVGLAVGVDYSLFYLRRAREERARGLSSADALQAAAATSGRAVLFSGFVVMTAMSGMFLMGSQIFASFGVGTVLVVAISLVGSLTVLPAVLSKVGDGVDRGRIPFLARMRAKDGESRFWGAVVNAVMRRPVVWGGAAAALLVALAIPALSLHTVDSGAQGLPRDLQVMKVYERVQKTFPGGAGPAVVVVSANDVTRPQVAAGHRGPQARGARDRPDAGADQRRGERVAQGSPRAHTAGRQGDRRDLQPRARHAAPRRHPRDDRQGARRRREGHRLDGGLQGLQRHDEGARADRLRVRARARVRAAAADLPLDRHPDQGDRAQPALGRRGVRRARPDLPEGQPRVAAALHVGRRGDRLAAAVPVRDPLRALDGLPRADPQPRARVLRVRHEHRGCRGSRHPRHGERRSPARRS